MFYIEYPLLPPWETVRVVDRLNIKQVRTMNYLITLHLSPPHNSLDYVKTLDGIKDLNIDEDYGLVLISPKQNLYVIRVSGDVDYQKLMAIQPLVKGVHGDVKIAPIQSQLEGDK
jgi:hypothetical protein